MTLGQVAVAGAGDAGPTPAPDAPWSPGGGRASAVAAALRAHGEVRIKPSLLAALDAVAKVAGAILALGISVALPIFLSEGGVEGAVGAFILAAIGGPFVLPAIIAAMVPAVRLAFTTYILDEEGIRVQTQILEKTEKRVQWEKVTAVGHRRTIVDRALGIERVDVIAYGMRGATIHLVGLRDAPALRDMVSRRMRETASVAALTHND